MTNQEIRDAFDMNDDGAGFAWSTADGFINYSKGYMTANDIIAAYKEKGMRKILPHVVHFRNATSRVCPELTHPYIVDYDSPNITEYQGQLPLLFHNGVLSNWKGMMLDFFMNNKLVIPDGDFSDTRFMAIMTAHLGKNVLPMLNAGKFVFMTNDIIDITGDFTNDNGILYSNLSYKRAYRDKGGVHTSSGGGGKGKKGSISSGGPLSVRYNPSARAEDDSDDDDNYEFQDEDYGRLIS